MDTEEEIELLIELQNSPLSLRMALYNITIASELEDRGQPAEDMEKLQLSLRQALQFSYEMMGKISLDTYDYIHRCFLE